MIAAGTRRDEILSAALACFVARGIDGATIADIRGRAGATTGSMYHFFEGKDAIVAVLYLEVLREYQQDLAKSLRRHTSARAFVRGTVEHYLSWVERRPDAARFLLDARHFDAIASAEDEIAAANAETFGPLFARVKGWMETGEILKLPLDLYLAILLGPVEAFTRQWLAKKTATTIGRARTMLAGAAWASVRGKGRP